MFKRHTLLLILLLMLLAAPCAAGEEAFDPEGEDVSLPVVADSVQTILDDRPDDVRAAQRCLANLGYYNSSVDGKFGKRTGEAIRAFQSQCALPETGHLDETTYALLMEYSSDNINAKAIQQRLIDLGYLQGAADGKFGEKSAAAMKLFQRVNHLRATGTANAETVIALFSDQTVALPAALSAGDKGEDVAMLQRNLIRYGFLTGEIDGEYGKSTAAAVRAFQDHLAEQEIPVDRTGNANPLMLFCLYSEEYSSYLRDVTPGMTDGEARRVELRLGALGYMDAEADDTFDDYAQEALRLFQRRADLEVSGSADRRTLDTLFSATAPEAAHCVAHDIASGDSGLAVRDVENAMVAAGFMTRVPTGNYDAALEKALELAAAYLGEGDNPTYLSRETVETLQGGLLELMFFNPSSEADALRLQRRLFSLYYMEESGIDGKIGGNTISALHDFQQANGLARTDSVDRDTAAAIFSLDAVAKPYPYRIEVSIDQQVVEVWALNDQKTYDLVQSFKCSTGLKDSTPRGVYFNGHPVNRWHYFKKFNCWAQYSYKIVDDIMFHSVIYGSKSESSLRRSSQRNLGNPASHGCVRLTVEDAKWLFEHCLRGTTVIVIR